MSPGDDTSPDPIAKAFDQFRHDLKTPLTTINVRAQLQFRQSRGAPHHPRHQLGAMLNSLAAIEAAVWAMVPRIDGIGRDPPDGRMDLESRNQPE